MDGIFNSKAYKHSRVAYYIQCVTEYLAALLVSDAFLAKLLRHLGLDDATTGIVSSLTSFTVCAAAFVCLIFTTEKTRWLIVGFTVLYNVSMAATAFNANNMSYSYGPIDYFVQAQAIRSSIAGTAGFLASLVGSRILKAVQQNGSAIFGISVYGQQILGIISLVLMAAAIVFNRRVVEKQTVMKQ